MYKSFFGLKENPFNVNPDPRYLFLTKQIEEALSGLMYGIQTRKGFITLTGEVGTGKTTLVNRLLDWLHLRRTKTAFLFNSRMNSSQLFDFILAELEEKLRLPQLRQLRQRITLRCKTMPMTKEQTHDYVQERLRIGGAAPQSAIFSAKALDAIHLYSMGIPRVINLLCEHALINSFVDQQQVVEPKVIENVAREFQLDEVEPIAPPASARQDGDVFQSEAFIQNLGEALSRFRMSPPVPK